MKKISMEKVRRGVNFICPLFMKFKIKYLMTIDPKGPLRDRFSGSECDDKKIRSSWLKYPRDTCPGSYW